MRQFAASFALLAICAPLAAGCDSPTMPDRRVRSLVIEVAAEDFTIGSGVTILLVPGETLQLGAEGRFADGSEVDLTGNAEWVSDNPEFVSITQDGVATGVAVGATKIRARFSDLEASASLATQAGG